MPRLLRIGGSFAIVLVAYLTYARVAVPWIEPPADPRPAETVAVEGPDGPKPPLDDPRRKMLEKLFSAGDWELGEDTQILESDRVRLLIRKWNSIEGNQVELVPCTMIFTPEGESNEADRIRQSIVLQAPQGARLKFDQPLDVRRSTIGRLVAGSLVGPITIRSQGKEPGPQDDLWAVTRDIDIDEQGMSNNRKDVQFRLGPNFGRGNDLHVKFRPGDRGTAGSHGLNIGGIESIELCHVEYLHLELGRGGPTAGPKPAPGLANPLSVASGAGDWPIEITCRGPFHFDMGRQLATFEDHVDVRRVNPQGPADQLACEVLGIHFARRRTTPPAAEGQPAALEKDRPAEKERSGMFDLQPRKVEARGNPVVVHAPSQEAEARGELLEYDLSTGRIAIRPYPGNPRGPNEGPQEVVLLQGKSEIHAPAIEYQLAEQGRLGQATAPGPGWLRAETKERPGQPLLARWNQELRIRPNEKEHVISLTGGAELGYGALGGLSAAEIHFWLVELPAEKGQSPQVRPDRMLARQQVRLNSIQLSGNVDQLEVWFEQEASVPGQEAAPMVPVSRTDLRLESMRMAMEVGSRIPSTLHTVWRPINEAGQRLGLSGPETPTAPPVPAVTRTAPASSAIGRHFEIAGRLLRARVVTVGKQSDVAELMVEGRVRFAETHTERPEDKPLLVVGERIHVLDAAQPQAAATVTGSPAHFEGRGLGLTGSNINLNRGTNRLWIEGPGQLNLVLDRDFEGRPIPGGMPVLVQWQNKMRVDGATVQFEDSVVVSGRDQRLRTDTLELTFKEPLPFGNPENQPRPEVERIRCRGGAVLEGREADERGQISWDRIEAADLAINAVTGAINAGGPGRVTSVRRTSGDPLLGPAGGRPSDKPPGPNAASELSGLGFLEVRFRREITGNFRTRRLTFQEQIEGVFGPVPTWESRLSSERPEDLGPRGGVLHCNRLTVVQMPGPRPNERTVELEAVGNTLVEGQRYTARGHSITYDQAKDLLILNGDGLTPARLYRQAQPDGPVTPMSARRILYWRSADKAYVEGFQSLDHQVPASAPRP